MTVVAVLSSKGGVGKTSVVALLASAAWSADVPTVVVDADPTANATWVLGIDPETPGLADVLAGSSVDALESGWSDSIMVVPAGERLAERTVGGPERQRLKTLLNRLDRSARLVLVDCPAGVGPLTRAVLECAAGALVVTEPSAFGVRAAEGTNRLIDEASERNPKLKHLGMVVNRLPGRGREAASQFAELEQVAKRKLWRPPLPARVVVGEAMGDRSAIHFWGVRGAQVAGIADAYLARLLKATDS